VLGGLGDEFPDQTVVAVCHAGVIIASMRLLLGTRGADGDARLRPTNTGLTQWDHDPESRRWSLDSFNETSHLLRLDAEGRG
jgi:probable phosphoglycerate mutase